MAATMQSPLQEPGSADMGGDPEGMELDPMIMFIARVASADGRFSEDDARQISKAFAAHIDSVGKKSLNECFGITAAQYGRSFARRLAQHELNTAMADAWHAMLDCDDVSPYKRCGLLAAEIRNFEQWCWPEMRESGLPPQRSALHCALYRAFKAFDKTPASSADGIQAQLRKIGVVK